MSGPNKKGVSWDKDVVEPQESEEFKKQKQEKKEKSNEKKDPNQQKRIEGNLITVEMRHDQRCKDIGDQHYVDSAVYVVAPDWVRGLLVKLTNKLRTTETNYMRIVQFDKKEAFHKIESFNRLMVNLNILQMLARNETLNKTGEIKTNLYGKIDQATVLSFKDLVKHSIIIGLDWTTHYGTYRNRVQQDEPVLLIDQIGLQFQRDVNSGRLVLIGDNLPKGLVDDNIFKNVVGEDKKTLDQVKSDTTGRYVKHKDVYFDTYAYQMFVRHDFILVCQALHKLDWTEVNLKFLRDRTEILAG